ncbi:MAG: hypothetical protein JXA20_08640 [Spirochaetes bacterium]|nr:hypothetical protein [Spirochaetota bacterium]
MEKETKNERFKRVAEKRVQNIIDGIQGLSGLSNRKVYEWEDAQMEKIWNAIEKEIEYCKASFKDPEARSFRL